MTTPKKTFVYTPREVIFNQEDIPRDAGFTGEIEVELIPYEMRLDLIQELNKDKKDSNVYDKAKDMLELVKKYTKKINLTHTESKTKFTDLSELGQYSEGIAVINHVGRMIINGVPLSPE